MNIKKTQSAGTRRKLHTYICSLLLSFLSVFVFAVPSYSSGILSNANSATCNNSTLEKYSGSSNLTAQWTGNHIDLYWYVDSDATTPMTVASESQDCTYGGSLTPPANIPSKTGYTFRGWRVRQAVCEIPAVLANNAPASVGYKGDASYNTDIYGLTENGTWAAQWASPKGIVYGIAKCAGKSGNNNSNNWNNASSNWTAIEGNLTTSGTYCWCLATGYDATNGEGRCDTGNTMWVYSTYFSGKISNCLGACARNCATNLNSYSGFRTALLTTE